jgi:hypothetical protein
MEIVEIYSNWLYSISFDNEDLNEYQKIFKEWHDIDYLQNFFTANKHYIDTEFWRKAGLYPNNPYKSADRVINEASNLEQYIKYLVSNLEQGLKPDLDSYFKLLGGKYNYIWTLSPVKSYGTFSPSLLRLYAIKIQPNCYLIVAGGIKLCKTIQDSPGLKDFVLQKIDQVIRYLKVEGITDSEDLT